MPPFPDDPTLFWSIDFPALLTGTLAAVSCALPGCLLVFRKDALMADAMSHVVLPGLVFAFLLTGTIAAWAMFAGALAACLLAAALIALIRLVTPLEGGAVMGIVFTSFFAGGVLLLETAAGQRVHLDTNHALYGALELSYWDEPGNWAALPHSIKILALTLSLTLAALAAFYKEIRLTCFDFTYAHSAGLRPRMIVSGILALAALNAVAAFEAVGSILVIAMFICPAAAARLWTDKYGLSLFLSAAFGALSAGLGYALAAWFPLRLGFDFALNAGGMIAFCSGMIVFVSALCTNAESAYKIFRKKETAS